MSAVLRWDYQGRRSVPEDRAAVERVLAAFGNQSKKKVASSQHSPNKKSSPRKAAAKTVKK
ncbi:hypothetical protein G5B88_17540 [Herbaspirillum seropedicae]|uniref:hypothetical protein n=1 Tax=Herbaspirillum seropedicae TaxID=964 RepID=UPI0012EDBC97|nr:hypothetical protein [Herbaspirillum seropedicae]UMU22832.1 hypothetical protein G5B88_17540 [Herbaspirillum seropedicae]